VLTLAQSESAGQAAFMTAAVLGLGAILGTLFCEPDTGAFRADGARY